MGNGMNKVLPGLFVGNYRDSKDQAQLNKYEITHIIAIHDSPRRLLPDKHYLCVMAADSPDQNLSQYFSVCNDFIHAARLRDGNVLIHCLAGMSRSVTVAVAYIMTATNLNFKEALKVVRAGRSVANPNAGFQTQLQDFEMYRLGDERRRLRERFPSCALEQSDRNKCVAALDNYEELLQNRNICEGNCSRGERCPTGEDTANSESDPLQDEPCSVVNVKRQDGRVVSWDLKYDITQHWRKLAKPKVNRPALITDDTAGNAIVLDRCVVYFWPQDGEPILHQVLTEPQDEDNVATTNNSNITSTNIATDAPTATSQ